MFIPVQTDKHGISAFYRTEAEEAEDRAKAALAITGLFCLYDRSLLPL
jgi:hypothetical protein